MGEEIKKYYNFWKSSWGKHYLISLFIFFIFIFFIAFIQFPDSNSYARVLLIAALIFFFILGHILSFYYFNMVKKLYTNIINLNDYSYQELTPKKRIPALLVVLPVYLIIFQTFFIFANYSFTEALLFGWLILLFVRSSHYVDKELGSNIGQIIGSFFIPFGFIIGLIKGASFYVDFSTGKIFINDYLPYVLFFIVFILATIPLEVLMDYRGKNKRINEEEKRKKTKWKNDPCYIKYVKK